MTNRRYRMAATALVLVAGTACGDDAGQQEQAAPPEPVVIESPRSSVLVGTDTVLVFRPTVFTYVVAQFDPNRPPTDLAELGQDYQSGLRTAEEPLRELGVDVVTLGAAPRVLGLTPEADAAAGPPLAGTSAGYLFVDAFGHVRRVASRMDANAVVCAAATTFGLTLNAQQDAVCR